MDLLDVDGVTRFTVLSMIDKRSDKNAMSKGVINIRQLYNGGDW